MKLALLADFWRNFAICRNNLSTGRQLNCTNAAYLIEFVAVSAEQNKITELNVSQMANTKAKTVLERKAASRLSIIAEDTYIKYVCINYQPMAELREDKLWLQTNYAFGICC